MSRRLQTHNRQRIERRGNQLHARDVGPDTPAATTATGRPCPSPSMLRLVPCFPQTVKVCSTPSATKVQVLIIQTGTLVPAHLHLLTYFFDYLELAAEVYAIGSAG